MEREERRYCLVVRSNCGVLEGVGELVEDDSSAGVVIKQSERTALLRLNRKSVAWRQRLELWCDCDIHALTWRVLASQRFAA